MFKRQMPIAGKSSPIADVVKSCRSVLWMTAATSGVINVLTLTGSIFMMQVYDRVLGSQSVPTLVALSAIAIFAYGLQGVLDALRNRIMVLIGEKIDAEVSPKVHTAAIALTLRSPRGQQESMQAFRDMEAIRAFVSGSGPIAAFDLPWLPLYLLVAAMLHPLLGIVTFVGAIVLLALTLLTERYSREPAKSAFEAGARRHLQLEATMRSSEAVMAMGMRQWLTDRWYEAHEKYLEAQRRATYVVAGFGVAAKTARMILQSAMLGIGAYLAIKGQISSGAIIAASILSSRALAPIDQAIAAWKPYGAARDGYRRLTALLANMPAADAQPFKLDQPKETIIVEDLAVGAPGLQKPAVQGVSFQLKAGQALGVVGASASGKSTLARGLVGVWNPMRGRVRLDKSTLDQWTPEDLGPAIGYLPQDFQLFEGTVAQNIGRFDPNATPDKIQAAAAAAGLDAYVRSVLGGYDATIGPSGSFLSAGQRQRVGLARALYGDPFLVVLDEPNSNLDPEGEVALQLAIRGVRLRGGIVVVIAHRPQVLAEVDTVLALANGATFAYGPRDEVLQKMRAAMQGGGQAPGPGAAPQRPRPAAAQLARPEGVQLVAKTGDIGGL